MTDTLRQTVPYALRKAPPDEELLEIARAARVNVLMDATDLPATPSQVETPWPGLQQWSLWNLFNEITTRRRLAWQPAADGRTFLFGAEPNLESLRARLLAGDNIALVKPRMETKLFNARLLEFFQREQGWNATRTDFEKTLALTALPLELQEEIVARSQRAALNQPLLRSLREVFDEEVWQSARLRLKTLDGQEKPLLALTLNMPTRNGASERILATWPAAKN